MINRDGQSVWTPDDPYGDEAEQLAERRASMERQRNGEVSTEIVQPRPFEGVCWNCGEEPDPEYPFCACDSSRPDVSPTRGLR